jgi:hypothetical protein
MKKGFIESIVLFIIASMVFSSVAIANIEIKEDKIELNTTHKGIAIGARDDIAWNNRMDYEGLMSTQYDDVIQYDCFLADDFRFDEYTELGDVYWIGGYWGTDYQTGDFDWCISFMYDDGSGEEPDSHPQNPSLAGPFSFEWDKIDKELLEDTGSIIFYKLFVELPERIPIQENEKIWISIWGIGQFPPQSGWGFHQHYQLNPAVWGSEYWSYDFWTPGYDVQGYHHDMCFQLVSKEPCFPDMDVEKYVWDNNNQEWIDADIETKALEAIIGTNVTFKIVVQNNGSGPLENILIRDKMHDSLEFLGGDPEPDDWFYLKPFYYLEWFISGPLNQNETIEVNITAHVNGPHYSFNFNHGRAEAGGCGETVEDEDYAWIHALKKGKSANFPFLDWLENHVNMFPMLKIILKLIGLF